MRSLLPALLLTVIAPSWGAAQTSLPATNFLALTHEHTDGLCILYNPSGSNLLSLVAWQRDLGLDLPTNQVIFVVKSEAKLSLPAGTPFGDAGQPFWILPQSQNPSLLYLGVNSERVPSGVFTGALTIRLKQLLGPGYFVVWQATGPGQYNIRINTRDGIGAGDNFMPMIGAHEHFNWGFSATGVYSATFQVTGQRIGENTNIISSETTFVFHVQPLPPATNFLTWQRSFWPPGFNPPTTLTNGNADGDGFNNLLEYAFYSNPTNSADFVSPPFYSFVTNASLRYGALAFTRYKPALDLDYAFEAASTLTDSWARQTSVLSTVANTNGVTETIIIRDAVPATNVTRFYRLQVNLQ